MEKLITFDRRWKVTGGYHPLIKGKRAAGQSEGRRRRVTEGEGAEGQSEGRRRRVIGRDRIPKGEKKRRGAKMERRKKAEGKMERGKTEEGKTERMGRRKNGE